MKFLRFITNSIRAKVALMIFSLTALLILVQSANTFVAEQNRGDAELLNHLANLRVIIQHIARTGIDVLYEDNAEVRKYKGEAMTASIEFFEGTISMLEQGNVSSKVSNINLSPLKFVPIKLDPQFLNRQLFERQLDEKRIVSDVKKMRATWEEWKPLLKRAAAGDTKILSDDIETAVTELEDSSNILAETIQLISNEKLDRIKYINFLILFGSVFLTVLFYISLRKLIVKPIENLKSAAISFTEGEMNIRAKIETDDEIGSLARILNKMINTVIEKINLDKERLAEIARKNEELQKASKLKSQFLANMSHELRTPMNSIIGYSEVLLDGLDGDLNEEQKEDITSILRSAEHLLKLINEILDLSKIEAGHMKVEITEVELSPLINDVRSTIEPLAKNKSLRLLVNLQEKLIVKADAVRLKQIVMNLISNAVKFTDQGCVEVNVYSDSNFAVLQVSDTGPGIPENELDKIFIEFHQVDGASTRKHGGTGLGLTIAKRFTELMNGKIEVESKVGKGTIFTLKLPLNLNSSENEKAVPHLLIVEDDTDALNLYTRYLENELPLKIRSASSINDALDILTSLADADSLPRAMIVDLKLSDGDGRELLKRIKSDVRFSKIQIGVISIEDFDTALMQYNVKAQAVKPISRNDFVDLVRKLIGGEK